MTDQAYQSLIDAIVRLGYPQEFGVVLAQELRTDNAMERMTAYLRSARPSSPEEIADELLAICSMRDRWIEQMISEHAGASLTAFYNRPREEE
ncbi:MAG: hypothetical protein Q4A01_02210 [Coriobacteriales bacterium]|nr:hypothetical protein [Coriobacteriales bacterium]